MALIITVKIGDAYYIGDDVKVTLISQKGDQVKVAIDAPRQISVDRESVRLRKIAERNRV